MFERVLDLDFLREANAGCLQWLQPGQGRLNRPLEVGLNYLRLERGSMVPWSDFCPLAGCSRAGYQQINVLLAGRNRVEVRMERGL